MTDFIHQPTGWPLGLRCLILAGLLLCASMPRAWAQPEEIFLNPPIKDRKSTPVFFPHGTHMENLECLECHHDYKDGENVLDEGELVEGAPAATCAACHTIDTSCQAQRYYHGLCMGCHVKSQASKDDRAPRMCIGCHQPETQKRKEP